MLLQKILPLVVVLLISYSVFGQKKIKSSQYKKHPYWIQMMNDTSVNFNETVKAFRLYYEERALPREANEVEGEDSFEREVGLEEAGENGEKSEKEREREKRKHDPSQPGYEAEVRAFKGWFYSIQPWVRSDGSIVGPMEQQAIIDRQHNELKEIENQHNKH